MIQQFLVQIIRCLLQSVLNSVSQLRLNWLLSEYVHCLYVVSALWLLSLPKQKDFNHRAYGWQNTGSLQPINLKPLNNWTETTKQLKWTKLITSLYCNVLPWNPWKPNIATWHLHTPMEVGPAMGQYLLTRSKNCSGTDDDPWPLCIADLATCQDSHMTFAQPFLRWNI